MDKKKTNVIIRYIHESIIIKILCFLGADSVIRCRSVCKNWASLIFSPYFADAYSSSSRTAPLQFLLQGTVKVASNFTKKHKYLVFANFAESSTWNTHTPRCDCAVPITTLVSSRIIDPRSSYHVLHVLSACIFTGFLVVRAYQQGVDEFRHTYHVYNPITSQHILVQPHKKYLRKCALLFAHKTGQLKLLKFQYEQIDGTLTVAVKIQTIGTDLWRTVTTKDWPQGFANECGFPCFLNGFYHWCWIKLIVCFNPEEEVFNYIQTPIHTEVSRASNLGLLDDCLCVCIISICNAFEFWAMNEYGVPESWTKKIVIPNHLNTRPMNISGPLKCPKSGEIIFLCQNNDVVCNDDRCCKASVICYNPSTGNHKIITYDGKDHRHLRAIPYIPNFKRFVFINN